MDKWEKCPICDGSGHIFEEPVAGFVFVKDCETCQGSGRVPADVFYSILYDKIVVAISQAYSIPERYLRGEFREESDGNDNDQEG